MVYVDTLMSCIPNKNWKWTKSCHLYADSIEELHQFALKIGMRLSWFQDDIRLPHYDLNENRRKIAVKNGAVEVSTKHTYEFMQRLKNSSKIRTM
jgi:hypothetical protein